MPEIAREAAREIQQATAELDWGGSELKPGRFELDWGGSTFGLGGAESGQGASKLNWDGSALDLGGSELGRGGSAGIILIPSPGEERQLRSSLSVWAEEATRAEIDASRVPLAAARPAPPRAPIRAATAAARPKGQGLGVGSGVGYYKSQSRINEPPHPREAGWDASRSHPALAAPGSISGRGFVSGVRATSRNDWGSILAAPGSITGGGFVSDVRATSRATSLFSGATMSVSGATRGSFRGATGGSIFFPTDNRSVPVGHALERRAASEHTLSRQDRKDRPDRPDRPDRKEEQTIAREDRPDRHDRPDLAPRRLSSHASSGAAQGWPRQVGATTVEREKHAGGYKPTNEPALLWAMPADRVSIKVVLPALLYY